MTIEYYNKLEQVDTIIDELVTIKNSLALRLIEERDDELNKAKRAYENACQLAELDFKYKMNYLDDRFSESLERVLSQLGEEMPEKVKQIKNEENPNE